MRGYTTYCLGGASELSDQYYKDIHAFTDEFFIKTEPFLPFIEAYRSYVSISFPHLSYPVRECAFEFLMLGILWKIYSLNALRLSPLAAGIMKSLLRLRMHGELMKQCTDFIRGIMSTLFLLPQGADRVSYAEPSKCNLNKLNRWLYASGDFNQEAERLRLWSSFLKGAEPQASYNIINASVSLASWFEIRSKEILGAYTSQVDSFLDDSLKSDYWREDVIFCRRRRIEYHMNMLGAEIMNRVFRSEFVRTHHRAVLLPACMCIMGHEKCKAAAEAGGLKCTGCTSGCVVNRLSRLGELHNFIVLIIKHESDSLSPQLSKNPDGSKTGIVGIACVLNLISGGWKAGRLGMPAQCIILDYCGCKKHWHPCGIATGINMRQFMKIMDIPH